MQQQIKALTEAIRLYDYAYYVLNEPAISDQQYDAMFAKLICMEAQHPEFAEPNSPTTRVGSDITNRFRKYPHPEPMLSVKSFYSIHDLKQNVANINEYTIEYKLDGISIEIEYRNGMLFRALTRGNGIEGEDVTDNIRIIKSIPLDIPASSPVIVVRGEIIITEQGLKDVNKLRKADKLEPYPNQRNAAASLVMLKNSAELYRYAVSGLRAYFYHILDGEKQHISLLRLQNIGFKTPYFIHATSLIQVIALINVFKHQQNKPSYPTDGIIIKANDKICQKQLGHTMRHVKWAWALKERSEELITRFHYIDYSVSKNGTITPVVHFKPISHQGITYQSSKTDWKTLEALQLSLLCNIHITIKGSVSAEITGSSNNFNPDSIKVPDLVWCPCCKTQLTIDKNMRRCLNPWCYEKNNSYSKLESTHKVFDKSYAPFHIVRFAAANSPAIVAKKDHSHAPIIFYRSLDHLAEIMFKVGIIGKFA